MSQVFSAEWFAEHQTALLRFANTRLGRRTLRIHGQRSAVGSRRIIRIEPHAITWANQDGSFSTEFRSHPKFAKRLYHAYKPLWWMLHGWDMGFANHVAPQMNAGFDTLTAYPEAGAGDVTVDGYTVNFTPATTFSSLVSGAGNDYFTNDDLWTQLEADPSSNKFRLLTRAIMTFDTSSISSLTTITAATLSLSSADKLNELGSPVAHIVSASPAQNNNLRESDYSTLGSTSFANRTYAAMTIGAYNDFSLNASGLANINRGGISGFGARLDWDLNNSFTGTWTSFGDSYFQWSDADTAGTASDPKLVVTYPGVKPTSVSGTLRTGGTVTAPVQHVTTITGTLNVGATLNITKQIAQIAGKEHLFRVYDQTGTYIGVWTDVISLPEYQQRINTPGTTMTVTLGRNANTTVEKRDTMATEAGVDITTEALQLIAIDTVTNNTVGPGTDVMENYFVDCYVYYGTFDDLSTENGQIITTESGEDILFPLGAPLGRRIFSGWIMDYTANYGDKDGVDVTIASNGSELANTLITSGSTTTVSYSSLDPGAIFRNIMAMNSGKMTYTTNTVLQTGGTTVSPTYRLNTLLDGIQDIYNRSPDGWYWYGNVADNNVYYQQKSATANHTFVLGKHIQSIAMSKSIENLKNVLYFVGGNPGSGILYKKYTGTSSVTRTGLDRQTDSRVTGAADALAIATKTFARYQNPIYTTKVTISSGTYDIESISLGQVVTFANFGNFIDGLLLQVIGIHYMTYTVELELGEILDKQIDIIANIQDNLDTTNWQSIPSAPS